MMPAAYSYSHHIEYNIQIEVNTIIAPTSIPNVPDCVFE